MVEPKQKPSPPRKKAEPEKPTTSGVGALLREERRNRSLDVREVARATRLREHFVEAIEQEAWDRLPPPVFVRGFIRSYARALGLDVARVLELYEQSGPAEQVEPKPLQALEPPGRGRRILLLLLLGLLAGILLYLWQGHPAPEWPGTPDPVDAPENAPAPAEPPVREPIGPESPAPVPEPAARLIEPPPGEETPAVTAPERRLSPPERALSAPPGPGEDSAEETVAPEEAATEGQAAIEEEQGLVIDVVERTWVQISVDGGEPRDFIFQPGSRPSWADGKTYDILIGNAAGVEVHFNGQTLTDLGKPGQVVRLVLPRDLESRDRGEP